MKVSEFSQDKWDDLLEKIEGESCILLIGPNLYKNKDGNILQNVLYKQLKEKYKNELSEVFPEDGFFTLNEDIINDMRFDVKKFYKQEFPDDNLKKIVEIPFHSIISFTPDILLKKTFDKYGINLQFERFSMTKPVDKKLKKGTKNSPFLYKMLGSVEEDETIILRHDDFFSYLKNIIGNERMPVQVQESISNATHLVFLGFPFEKWWAQLLMRLLGLQSFKGRNRWAVKNENENNFTKINKQQFGIDFIEDEADEFIDCLYKNYSDKKMTFRKLNETKTQATNAENEIKDKQVSDIKSQILEAWNMRNDYAKDLQLEGDRRKMEKIQLEINRLNKIIQEKTAELKNLQN